jgi:predicted MFS family arabinose efflux permease
MLTGDRERAGLRGTFANRGLRHLYGAEAVSGAGDGIFWVSLVVFLTDQPSFGIWLTLAAIARLAPRALLSLPAGALVDRRDLRRVLVIVDLVRGVLMFGLAVVVTTGGGPLVALLIVLASYTAGAPSRPAMSAIIPPVASERHLAGANAVLSTIRQTMTVVGPLLGVAVATASPEIGFVVNGVTLTVAALLFLVLPRTPGRPQATDGPAESASRRTRAWRTATEGLRTIRRTPSMLSVVVLVGVMSFVRGAELILHVYVVRDLLGVSVSSVGLLGGAMGIGAIVALPIAARAASWDQPIRPVVAALTFTAIPTALLALTRTTLAACVLVTVVGASMVVFEVVVVVLIQRVTAHEQLGGVFGAVNSASNTGKLLGALAALLLVAGIGIEASLVTVGSLVLAAGVVTSRQLVPLGQAAALRRRALQPTVNLLDSLEIFDGAPRSALERLADQAEEEQVPAGHMVIEQGDDADDLFICLSGSFDIVVDERVVAGLEPVTWFGEIGLVGNRPRTATVRATRDARIWRIPGTEFLDTLEETGAAPSALVEGIADRLAAHW